MIANKESLVKVVGEENIFDDPAILDSYSHDRSFAISMKPRLVVKPKNVTDVQGIVKWANESGAALIPVSSGRPQFHGDTVPTSPGAVIVDLSLMKRILRIDRKNRFTVIEPGVTYTQLQPELAKNGLRLTTPLLPRANKSVVASLLEQEPRLVPRYQLWALEPLRCVEVVWGDGQRMTTGSAESMGNLEEEWSKNLAQLGFTGPGNTDFIRLLTCAQGSMGIVTWASLRCEILPELHKLFFVSSDKLDKLINFAYRLLRFRFGDELLLMNNFNLAAILAKNEGQIKDLAAEFPKWTILVGIAGRERLAQERVEFLDKDISEIAQQFGLQLLRSIPAVKTADVLKVLLNPSSEPYWKLSYKSGCQDIFFLTTLDKTPGFIDMMQAKAELLGYPVSEIGIYIQPVQQGVSCHCEFNLFYNPNNPNEVARVRKLYAVASEELLKQGAYFSRPYGIWADMAYNRDAQTRSLLKNIKTIFDPNNVMNPGKLCF